MVYLKRLEFKLKDNKLFFKIIKSRWKLLKCENQKFRRSESRLLFYDISFVLSWEILANRYMEGCKSIKLI